MKQKYNCDKSQPSEQIFANTYLLKYIKKCSYCGPEHEIKRENAQHLGKLIQIAFRRTIFKQYANSESKTLKKLKRKPIWKSFQ